MEEEKPGHLFDEEVKLAVQKFERMKKNNENYFFDVSEFESIIDYYIENNNSPGAFEAADMATRQHPNSISIQLRKAKVLLDKGRALEALRLLRRLESIEPGNFEIYIAKGAALGIMGDIQGAKKMFDYALSIDNEEVENTLFSIVSVLQNLNYYEHLIPYLERLKVKEPHVSSHLYDLAYAYDRKGDLNKCVEYYHSYINEEPFSDSAWYNLGVIFSRQDKPEKAIEAYDFALAINSENLLALFNKGNILCNLERYPEAIAIFHEYIDAEPDCFDARNSLAECYERSGDYNLARQYYREAIELAPDSADAWFGLGIIELNTGNVDNSLLFFRKAVRLDDENPEPWFLLGKAHYAKGEIKSAIACIREALKLDAYYEEVWGVLGKILIKEKLVHKAIPYLEKAYRVTGDIPGINYLISVLNLHAGNRAKALKHMEMALEIDNEIFDEFDVLFSEAVITPAITKLLKKYNLR